jgi:hypothetical protein
MKNCPGIARNYRLYKELLAKQKQTSAQTILLIDRSESSLWKEKTIALKHDSANTIDLCIAKQNHDLKYRLKLFIKELDDKPLLYFDSDGPPIRNTNPLIRLSESRIKTPHLNYYNEQGFVQAKRDVFIETHEDDLQNDINAGMAYFCSIININVASVIPKVTEFLPFFHLSQNTDVHAGVIFPFNHGNPD